MNRAFGWMRNFAEDVRFSARQVRRAPGHAVFTVLVLALGIGTVTAMFTIAYAVLLKPLPFEADRRLYLPVENSTKGEESVGLPYAEIQEWQRATLGTAEVAFNSGGVNIADGPAGAVLITEVEASQNLFPLLGAKPMMGRGFLPEEEEQGRTDVVVLSYALWQQNFAGDRDVLGKMLHIGGNPRTVVGVLLPVAHDPDELGELEPLGLFDQHRLMALEGRLGARTAHRGNDVDVLGGDVAPGPGRLERGQVAQLAASAHLATGFGTLEMALMGQEGSRRPCPRGCPDTRGVKVRHLLGHVGLNPGVDTFEALNPLDGVDLTMRRLTRLGQAVQCFFENI